MSSFLTRRATCVVGLVLAALIAGGSIAGTWHYEDTDHSCTVCKIGHQSVIGPVGSAAIAAPAAPGVQAHIATTTARTASGTSRRPSRAPPA